MASDYKLKKGEAVFEVELATGNIKPAKYKQLWHGKQKAGKVLVERKEHIYLPALNKQHAKYKFDAIVSKAKATPEPEDGQLHCVNCNQILADDGVIRTHCDNCTVGKP